MSRKPQPIRESKYRAIINGLLELLAKCFNHFVNQGENVAWQLQRLYGKFFIVDKDGNTCKFDVFYQMLKSCLDKAIENGAEEKNKPAKVYIAFRYASESQCPPDTTEVIGVFSTPKAARACIEKYTKGVLAELKDTGTSISYSAGGWYNDYYYEEHEVE